MKNKELRKCILSASFKAGVCHIGSALSCLDVKIVATRTSPFLGDSHNFLPWEREPLLHLSKKFHKTYIRL